MKYLNKYFYYTWNLLYDVQTFKCNAFSFIAVCIFEGQIYHSAEQILRDDPCEFCFCFRGDIICLQQSCPPPAPNCHSTMIAGYCCPRYDCRKCLVSLYDIGLNGFINRIRERRSTRQQMAVYFFVSPYVDRCTVQKQL